MDYFYKETSKLTKLVLFLISIMLILTGGIVFSFGDNGGITPVVVGIIILIFAIRFKKIKLLSIDETGNIKIPPSNPRSFPRRFKLKNSYYVDKEFYPKNLPDSSYIAFEASNIKSLSLVENITKNIMGEKNIAETIKYVAASNGQCLRIIFKRPLKLTYKPYMKLDKDPHVNDVPEIYVCVENNEKLKARLTTLMNKQTNSRTNETKTGNSHKN